MEGGCWVLGLEGRDLEAADLTNLSIAATPGPKAEKGCLGSSY